MDRRRLQRGRHCIPEGLVMVRDFGKGVGASAAATEVIFIASAFYRPC